MIEIAPPSPARSGGATSPHSGIVPRPAASHPRPVGALCAGTLFPPCKTAPAGLPSSRGLSWTQEEIERLAELRAEGRTREECAAALGRTIWGLHFAINRLKLAPQTRRWSVEEIRTLLRMKIERRTYGEIAAAVKHSENAAAHKWAQVAAKLPPGLADEIADDMRRLGSARRAKGGA